MDSAEYQMKIARAMTERVLQERVRQTFLWAGWLFYHTHRAEHSPAGFPDCVGVREDRLVFAELKRQDENRHQPSAEQQRWLDALGKIAELMRTCGPIYDAPRIEVYLWRPLDLIDGTVAKILT